MEGFFKKSIEWNRFRNLFTKIEVPSKTLLLSEGEISKKVFYIEKGCLRSYFNDDGKDITFQFFFEKQNVASMESFLTNQSSIFNIESLEPSIIHYITKKDFDKIIAESSDFKQAIENHTFNRLIHYQKLFLSRIKDNPQKRYLELLERNPEILVRIPQHYIASYLGITTVSLSRIRNRK